MALKKCGTVAHLTRATVVERWLKMRRKHGWPFAMWHLAAFALLTIGRTIHNMPPGMSPLRGEVFYRLPSTNGSRTSSANRHDERNNSHTNANPPAVLWNLERKPTSSYVKSTQNMHSTLRLCPSQRKRRCCWAYLKCGFVCHEVPFILVVLGSYILL